MDLQTRKCKPCEKGATPLSSDREEALLSNIKNWELTRTGIHRLKKRFIVHSFSAAMGFVVQIGLVAETQGHHPNICIFYDKVDVELYTHSVNGLSENDFIVAARIDHIFK